ncbi:MAG: hypothetical protein IKR81_05355 [Victivallales bacterium]|nr:hypothetical protein [Victivallales bacterium]
MGTRPPAAANGRGADPPRPLRLPMDGGQASRALLRLPMDGGKASRAPCGCQWTGAGLLRPCDGERAWFFDGEGAVATPVISQWR